MITSFKEEEFKSGFNTTLWKRIAYFLKYCKKNVVWLFIFALLASICEAMFPLLNKFAFDNLLGDGFNQNNFIFFTVCYLMITILQPLTFYGLFRNTAKIEGTFGCEFRSYVYKKLMNLSFDYFDSTPLGWILARVTSDITRIAEVVSWSMFDLTWGFISVLVSTIVMFSVSPLLAILIIILLPFLVAVTYYFQKKILVNYRTIRKFNSIITGGFNEGINGAKTTKTLGIEDQNLKEFSYETMNMQNESIKAGKVQAMYRPIINMFSGIAMALILWFGGNLVFDQMIPLGTLVMFCQYAVQFFDPLYQIANILSEAQLAQASAERVISLLDTEVSITDSKDVIEKYGTILNPKPQEFENIKGKVTFENVSFQYIENELVLDNFSLEVSPKQTIALVGATGGGKSTIINLLSRFYEPTKGKILIDDIDYKERSIGWLHSQLGYVLQTPHLFSGTIADNIRYGKNDATIEEIIQVCKLVDAHSFIMKLEKGYDSEVGEAGGFLSTGQKQLLSFARALIHNPNIVILDEATSSIDTESEMLIQNAIEKIIENKTTFIVAHRLSTIVSADKIVVINKGKILEQGSHLELMKLKKHYYRLYTNQFNESLENELLNSKKGAINEN